MFRGLRSLSGASLFFTGGCFFTLRLRRSLLEPLARFLCSPSTTHQISVMPSLSLSALTHQPAVSPLSHAGLAFSRVTCTLLCTFENIDLLFCRVSVPVFQELRYSAFFMSSGYIALSRNRSPLSSAPHRSTSSSPFIHTACLSALTPQCLCRLPHIEHTFLISFKIPGNHFNSAIIRRLRSPHVVLYI
ncbi:unnamed protein product [Ectocarpus sp. 6 AP-2014]